MANTGAQVSPVFQPALRVISNISAANPCVITTTFAHNYLSTDAVKIFLPRGFPMQQLNNAHGLITVIDSTSFYFPYDTTIIDAFADPGNGQNAQVVPHGENTNTVAGAVHNTLPTRTR